MDILSQDIRYAIRTLAKNPGFTAVTVVGRLILITCEGKFCTRSCRRQV